MARKQARGNNGLLSQPPCTQQLYIDDQYLCRDIKYIRLLGIYSKSSSSHLETTFRQHLNSVKRETTCLSPPTLYPVSHQQENSTPRQPLPLHNDPTSLIIQSLTYRLTTCVPSVRARREEAPRCEAVMKGSLRHVAASPC